MSADSKKIAAGKSVQLTAFVMPENASDKKMIYTSGNTKYATINSDGKVTTKKAGAGKTVTITVKAADGSGIKASYKITIMKHAVKSIKLSASSKNIKMGKKLKVNVKLTTTGKKVNKTLQWSVSNKKYASVDKKGQVTAKKAGKGKTVTITARSTDGTNKKGTIRLKIK